MRRCSDAAPGRGSECLSMSILRVIFIGLYSGSVWCVCVCVRMASDSETCLTSFLCIISCFFLCCCEFALSV